jgi:hypothetical protein
MEFKQQKKTNENWKELMNNADINQMHMNYVDNRLEERRGR